MPKPRTLIDQALADWLSPLLEPYTDVLALPTAAITHLRLQTEKVEALFIRTTTNVNATLLQNTQVKFVASASAGIDHLDTTWLEAHQIAWCYAPGANASAVRDYVLCCIAALRIAGKLPSTPARPAAVIGVGRVGTLVADLLKKLNYQVLQYDPPRAAQDPTFHSVNFTDLKELELACIHTPLTHTERHPTFHMLNRAWINKQTANTVILNAGRGHVIEETAMQTAENTLCWCLDVWANEPAPAKASIEQAYIATPHIAGYSLAAKQQACLAIFNQAAAFFQWSITPLSPSFNAALSLDITQPEWEELALNLYHPLQHSQMVKNNLLTSAPASTTVDKRLFEYLRNSYPLRQGIELK